MVIGGQCYQFVAFKNLQATTKEEKLVLLLTSLKVNQQAVGSTHLWITLAGPKPRLSRGPIECMFKNLKSNGFNLEGLSLVKPAKIRLLVSMVVAAYVLCVTEGIKQLLQIRTRITRQGKLTRYESSFRKGYAWVSLKAQQIELFLDFLLINLGRPIRILKPT